jgi:hypothetical protein
MNELGFAVAGVLGHGIEAALFATTRLQWVERDRYLQFRDRGEPVIFVLWHAQLLPLLHHHRHEGVVALVSEHADGEYITRIIRHDGFDTVRGSSTRGAAKGLKGLVRAARAGRSLALTVDGPRGPAHVFKPGALAAAQITGLPILPLAAGVSSAWRAGSWDGFMIPKPFSTIRIEYGRPRRLERDADRATLEALGAELQEELDALTRRVEAESAA